MSKIQDALRRLQENGEPPKPRREPTEAADVRQLPPAHSDGDVDDREPEVDVDLGELRTAGLYPPEVSERDIADQFRAIKRPLIANAYGKRVARVENGNIIAVASALPGEGKTFTSINLALSIARERDNTVLLVDADFAKPNISTVFGLNSRLGLLDIVENGGSVHPEEAAVATDIPGLSILPAGANRETATELMASSSMERVVQELAHRKPGRFLIFDTPPLLHTAEASVVADLVGQVVMVVRAESTSHAALREALAKLGDKKAINLVLNQSRSTSFAGGYGARYGSAEAYPYKREQSVQASATEGSLWEDAR